MSLSAQTSDGEPFGRYRLIEQIGAGGMALVYRAVQPQAPDAAPVVIKRMLPELSRDPVFVKMLVAEARLSSRLVHPNIVQVHELGLVGNEYFLSMEYCDGADLARVLNRCVAAGTALPIGLACHIVHQIASALAYAHDLADGEGRPLEIIHRDVSPANIMTTSEGAVKLLDFGVAKAAAHVRDDRTRTGTLKGKINYLSPEQAEGLEIDRRSDLFALGIVLYESLTMRRLFRGDSDLVTLRMIRQCEVSAPSTEREGVPPELDAIVLKMLARDPAQRYARADEIVAALEPLTKSLGGDPVPVQLQQFIASLGPLGPAPVPRNEVVEVELDSGPTFITEHEALKATNPAPPASALAPSASETAPPSSDLEPTPAVSRWRSMAPVAGLALLLVGGAVVALRPGAEPATSPPAQSIEHPPTLVAPPPAPSPPTDEPAPPAPVAAPTPKPGHLLVLVDVSAAQISLDGKLVGDRVHRARIDIDQPGEHHLLVTAPRRKPYERTVVVPESADITVQISLNRARRDVSPVQSAPQKNSDGNYLVDPFAPKP
jgi:serine/threonine protein kinase